MREPLPSSLSATDARLLAVVATLIPAPYGEAIAGDLAESWSAGRSHAHSREAADAVLRCWGALGARTLTRQRAPLAVGAAFGLLAHIAAWALWRTILSIVPLRADHPPHLGWMVVTSIVAAAIAALGWHLGRALREASAHDAAPPESFT